MSLIEKLGAFLSFTSSPTVVPIQQRMTNYIKRINGYKCHPFKPHIVTLKCNQLLQHLNSLSDWLEKYNALASFNNTLTNVSKQLYERYDPNMIYCFNNEIHLVFFYNEYGDFIYNGDIMKTTTSMASTASVMFSNELSLPEGVVFNGTFVEFDKEWVHLRKSNTEPIIRIYSESESMTTANTLAEKIISLDISSFCFYFIIYSNSDSICLNPLIHGISTFNNQEKFV